MRGGFGEGAGLLAARDGAQNEGGPVFRDVGYSTGINPDLGCGRGAYANCYYYDSNGNLTKKLDNRGVGVNYGTYPWLSCLGEEGLSELAFSIAEELSDSQQSLQSIIVRLEQIAELAPE